MRFSLAAATLVAGAALGTPYAASAAPPTDALTIQLEQYPWSGSTRTILVLAAGGSPVAGPLLDANGDHRLWIYPAPSGACKSMKAHYTGLGTSSRWCLTVSGIASGLSAVGVLHGAVADVSLTLNIRDAWPLPLAASLTGVIIAAALLYMTSIGLSSMAAAALLRWRQFRDASKIAGLTEWTDAAKAHLSNADMLSRIQAMKASGIAQVHRDRQQLQDDLKRDSVIPPKAPLRVEAEQEAGLPPDQAINASDMFAPDGTPAASHAARLFALVNQAHQMITDWETQVTQLMGHVTARREEAARLVTQTRSHLNDLSAKTIDATENELRTTLTQLAGYADPIPNAETQAVIAAATLLDMDPILLIPSRATFLTDHQADGLRAIAGIAAVGAVTVVIIAIAMLLGAGTALSASYFSNHTFGAFEDYVALITTSFASASVAAILATVLAWTRPGRPS